MAKTAKKSATKTAKKSKTTKTVATKSAAPVAKKATAKTPNPMMEKLFSLMLRKEGAGIADFQTVDGFNLPSMAVVKAAQRQGYEAFPSKKPGERTRYYAKRT
jgi:hypothetical protein